MAQSPAPSERFRDARREPFFDLLALIRPKPSMRVLDIGCGDGVFTRLLHERLGAADTHGIENTEKVLEECRKLDVPGLRFTLWDDAAAPVAEGSRDLVFANGVLQWLPDHPHLLGWLTRILSPGGQLAVQMPVSGDEAADLLAVEVASDPPFREVFSGEARRRPVLAPEEYATLLHKLGYANQKVRVEVYGSTLSSLDEVIAWAETTHLMAYLRRLPGELSRLFLERYGARILDRMGQTPPCFCAIKRLLLWAER